MTCKKVRELVHAFAFVPWLSFLSQGGSALPDHSKIEVALGTKGCKVILKTYVADFVLTDESRAKGLGNRSTPLKSNEGMLFFFEKPQRVAFWMKDTLIPLEIMYFGTDGKLAEIHEMPVEPDPKNPVRQYKSRVPAISALEVEPKSAQGLIDQHPELCAQTLPR